MQKKFSIKGIDQLQLLGFQDGNLRLIQQHFKTKIVVRGSVITIDGSAGEVRQLEKLFSELIMLVDRKGDMTRQDVETLINLIRTDKKTPEPVEDLSSAILSCKSGFIRPKTRGQQRYYQSTVKNDIVFVIGPAGTGKTYLAVAVAVAQLKAGEVERLILTRPAVEAGESLGFLPGDFREKVDPYLRPLYDALYDMMSTDKLRRMIERGEVEIVPLAYMRGRTLNGAFVILDEAQNTSSLQMKMFLTRLGISSKAIITGDITQIDISDKRKSGLIQIQSILQNIEGIDFIYLNDKDVVRHRLVREIIKAYDFYDEKTQNAQNNHTESSSENEIID